MRTEAEKKEAKAIAQKKYYNKNKEKIATYHKERRKRNKEVLAVKDKAKYDAKKDCEDFKEKRKANNKAWRDKNPDYAKAWRDKNKDSEDYKEKNKARTKAWNEAIKLQFYVVYTIDNYDGKGNNYCGVTSRPDGRMTKHRFDGKLNVDDYSIVGTQVEKADALAIERDYHSRGYHGNIWRLRRE